MEDGKNDKRDAPLGQKMLLKRNKKILSKSVTKKGAPFVIPVLKGELNARFKSNL